MLGSTDCIRTDEPSDKAKPYIQNTMRTRKIIKSPLFTAKANGEVIRRTEVVLSTQAKINRILKELGGDSQQILRDIRWERLCQKASLL